MCQQDMDEHNRKLAEAAAKAAKKAEQEDWKKKYAILNETYKLCQKEAKRLKDELDKCQKAKA